MKTNKFEATMDRFSGWIEQYLAPPLVRMGNQRHFAAIRAALISLLTLIIRKFSFLYCLLFCVTSVYEPLP